MIKKKILLFTVLFYNIVFSQVGINTETPNSTLEVVGKGSITSQDGIIPPKITKQQLAAKVLGTYTGSQTGAIVFVTDVAAPTGILPSLSQVDEITTPGNYYFDGLLWKKMGGGTGDTNIYSSDGTLTSDRIVNQDKSKLTFNASSVNAFSVDSSTFSVDAENNRIGIGTINPQRVFHIDTDSSTVRLQNLPILPNDQSATGLVVNSEGDIYKNNTTSVEGQILRLGINFQNYEASDPERSLRFSVHNSAQDMGNAPNGAPNFINSIVGSTIVEDISVPAGAGLPARITDQIILQPGVYKILLRVVGNFSNETNTNALFIKCIVNNNEYSIINNAENTRLEKTYYFEDYINITDGPQPIDFTIKADGSRFTIKSYGSPGVGNSYRSLLLIQRLR